MTEKVYDLIVVGGGPAGLTAYLYAKRALLDVCLVEKGPIGGQVLLTDWIENYPGFPEGVSGFDLIELFKKQVEKLGLEVKYDEAIDLTVDGNLKIVHLATGEKLKAYSIILALGAAPKRLGILGEDALIGKGVSYCAVCDGPFFRDEIVAVVGGGDTALQESLYLTRFVKKGYLIHRRDAFRAIPILQKRVRENPKIELILNSVVREIHGKEKVEEILVENLQTGESFKLKVSGVFIFIGLRPQTEWLKGKLDLDENGFILTDKNMETSLPGVFACGDCVAKKFRQIVIACGEGAVASLSAEEYIQRLKNA